MFLDACSFEEGIYMIITVASGKGGTGKTTIALNLALSLRDVQLIDCDVEEPNVHLFLPLTINEERPVHVTTPQVNEELCDNCGKCSEFCQFNAIFVSSKEVSVFPELCSSCGGCTIVCPKEAINERRREIGIVKSGSTGDLEVVYGELNVGEPMVVPVINEAKRLIKDEKNVIVDSPPGTSCPAIASVKGSDFCILVTEPTPFGLHDLKIAIQVLEDMKIPFGVVVNCAGLGDRKVYKYCEERNTPILLEIPHKRRIAELYSKGKPFSLEMLEWKPRFQKLFDDAVELAGK
jgi:MinD superfamily P-loop ATPase